MYIMNRLYCGGFVSPVTRSVQRSIVLQKCTSSVSQIPSNSRRMFTNGRFCIQNCLKFRRDFCVIKFRFSSSQSKIPKKFRKPLLPFEVEANLNKETVVFTYYGKEWFYKYFSIGGIFLFLTLLNSSELIYRYLRIAKIHGEKQTKDVPWYFWWKNVNFGSDSVRLTASVSLAIFGVLSLVFFMFYPTRIVREITVLKGGEKILFETYRPFGYTKAKEIPLRDISAQWGPKQVKDYLPIRLKGKRLHYLISVEGKFPDRKLFDDTIGRNRF
ncbi:hypothetical protein ACF0H5_003632 [Mactra antiquata]